MRVRMIALVAMLALALPMAGTALADGDEVEKHGTCTLGSRWALDAEDEGKYLEVDFEIDTTKASQDWRMVLKHDGIVFFNQVRATESDGDVDVERHVRDHAGSDGISGRGVNLTSGEVCRGALKI
jgi:hypothetical protein